MGNSQTQECRGLPIEITFPTSQSIIETNQLALDAAQTHEAIGQIAGIGVSYVPFVGNVLGPAITFLTALNVTKLQYSLVDANINAGLLQNNFGKLDAEIKCIQSTFERLNRADLTIHQMRPEAVYAFRRCVYIFELFKQKDFLLYKYPLHTTLFLGTFANIFHTALNFLTNVDETYSEESRKIKKELKLLYEDYAKRFETNRLNDIDRYNCKKLKARRYSYGNHAEIRTEALQRYHIYDRPWKDQHRDKRDTLHFNWAGKCFRKYWAKSQLSTYTSVADYKYQLKTAYEKYFLNIYPAG